VDLKIYDESVQVGRLVGGNKAFIDQALPHLARLLVASTGELDDCETIVIGHSADRAAIERWSRHGKGILHTEALGLSPAPTPASPSH
jgi:hypothetical protein